MFQKCPICKGKGFIKNKSCNVCNGERIINKDSGLPPSKYTTIPNFVPVYPWYNPTYIGSPTNLSDNTATLT